MGRFFYTIRQFIKFKNALYKHLSVPKLYAENITELSPYDIHASGIEILILDFDGVLASHGETKVTPKVMTWLMKCTDQFQSNQIFILSNKPLLKRRVFFRENFPNIVFMKTKKKKPYPDGILQIMKDTSVSPENIMIIDDRLATGILAAEIAGIKGCLITKPYTNFLRRPISESFFMILRWLERQLARW